MHKVADDVTTVTETPNEPQPEMIETPAPQPEQETTALIPTEPDVVEGEVIEIESPDTSQDHTPHKQKPYWLLIPFTILCCLVFVAVSSLIPFLTPSATVTIIPAARTINLTAAIRIPGRQVAPLTLSQSTSVAATGIRHQDATRAQGAITFYNGLFSSQTIAAGTLFTGRDGVQIITDQAAIIPAGAPPIYGQVTVSAHAVLTGARGNIPAYDINQACCSTSVLAKNTQAFTGGRAARAYVVVTQADIDHATAPLTATLEKSEHAALTAQLNTGEEITSPPCSKKVQSDHKPGEEAAEVQVSVSETCTGIAYAVAQVLQREAMQWLGTGRITIVVVYTG